MHNQSSSTTAALLLALLLLPPLATPLVASMCDTDEDPAATLLLPYFEVNLDNPAAGNTIFTINNAFDEPALAHITFWTDWSHPTIDFDIFLTGYDVQPVNLADVFLLGNVPITADQQTDAFDQISPHGGYRPHGGTVGDSHPNWDGSFTECENFFPFFQNPLITNQNLDRLLDGHTGQPHVPIGGACMGADLGDNVARGYITIDRVNRCSLVFPSEEGEGYFAADGTGIASNENQLWGDWIYFDRENGFAHGDSLVHIEALDGFDALGDGTSDSMVPDPATGTTFYGRYTQNGEDNREPLGTSWGVRYLNNALFEPGGTDLYVWRDPNVDRSAGDLGYPCGSATESDAGPDWHPLNEKLVIAFDEYENAVDMCSLISCGVCSPPYFYDPICFPLATQRMNSKNIGFTGMSSPWGAGWFYLDLRIPSDEGPVPDLSQSYVWATHSALGLLSVGLPAVELSSACQSFEDYLAPVI